MCHCCPVLLSFSSFKCRHDAWCYSSHLMTISTQVTVELKEPFSYQHHWRCQRFSVFRLLLLYYLKYIFILIFQHFWKQECVIGLENITELSFHPWELRQEMEEMVDRWILETFFKVEIYLLSKLSLKLRISGISFLKRLF